MGLPTLQKNGWCMQYSDFCDSDLPFEGDYTSHLLKNIDQYQGHGM